MGEPKDNGGLLDIATKFTDMEDTLGAIFCKGKGPRDASEPNGEKWECQELPNKRRRNHHPLHNEEEVAKVDRRPRP